MHVKQQRTKIWQRGNHIHFILVYELGVAFKCDNLRFSSLRKQQRSGGWSWEWFTGDVGCRARLAQGWLTGRHVEPCNGMCCGRRHSSMAPWNLITREREPHLAWEFSQQEVSEEWKKWSHLSLVNLCVHTCTHFVNWVSCSGWGGGAP